MDHKRRQSLSYVSSLSQSERKNALRRINENALTVAMVREKLMQRLSSYRFALERLAITTPSPQAAEAEHQINLLQAGIARYRQPAPSWVREQNLASAR